MTQLWATTYATKTEEELTQEHVLALQWFYATSKEASPTSQQSEVMWHLELQRPNKTWAGIIIGLHDGTTYPIPEHYVSGIRGEIIFAGHNFMNTKRLV